MIWHHIDVDNLDRVNTVGTYICIRKQRSCDYIEFPVCTRDNRFTSLVHHVPESNKSSGIVGRKTIMVLNSSRRNCRVIYCSRHDVPLAIV